MNKISYQSFFPEEPQSTPHTVKTLLPPPNPIIRKDIESDQKVSFKMDILKGNLGENREKGAKPRDKNEEQKMQSEDKSPGSNKNVSKKGESLCDEYDESKMIFKKYHCQSNKRGEQVFLASIFISLEQKKIKLPQYNGMIKDDQLIFDSNFQSGNLMAVYKTGSNTYDLLLQNDVNTGGFTQWYNFRIVNKRNNFVAKFHIVNLYKSKSLYNMGMKPCVYSQKSNRNGRKSWRRKGFNIFYDQNEISYQDNNKKCYKTLAFEYDFTVANDTTLFAHAMPYEYNNLESLLASIKGNPKVTVNSAGVTIMGQSIPIIKIKSTDNSEGIVKKAIVIMARQHPGQTPGSYIAQEMILQLLRHSLQIDFIVWRFDIYIFPMINIDGVIVGNYRSNLSGYDLNRCWIKSDPVKHPEIFVIKNYIRKLAKKQDIELILDLHGHSRKMGSFFYGNKFGKNPELLPYIASKMNSNIIFQDSRFSKEKAAKASTARVVLGSMIKETGNVYTFEVSFFGNYKNNLNKTNTFSFNEEHYRELAKSLLVAVYKTYIEVYKEEKTLKESIFLKNIRKEIQEITKNDDQNQSGSDSEAQLQMTRQMEYLQEYHKQKVKQRAQQPKVQRRDEQVMIIKGKSTIEYTNPIQKMNNQIKMKISQLISKNSLAQQKNKISKRLPSIYQNNESKNISNSVLDLSSEYPEQIQKNIKKQKLKLKIYGEPFQLKSRFQQHPSKKRSIDQPSGVIHKNNSKKIYSKSKHYSNNKNQLIKSYKTININENTEILRDFEHREMSLNNNRNGSLVLKEVKPEFSDFMISDVVKVHKLDHSKNLKHKNLSNIFSIKMSNNNFKLPNI